MIEISISRLHILFEYIAERAFFHILMPIKRCCDGFFSSGFSCLTKRGETNKIINQNKSLKISMAIAKARYSFKTKLLFSLL